MIQWKTKTVKLDDMHPMECNARKIDASAAKALKASINRFGMVELIVWNEQTGHIVSGHQRYSVLKSQGVKEVPVIVVDMDEANELAAAITMNNTQISGEYTNPVVELLDSIRDNDADIYASLRMENLRDDLSDLMDKVDTKELEKKVEDDGKNWDTECPCCGHKWKIGPSDIALEKE